MSSKIKEKKEEKEDGGELLEESDVQTPVYVGRILPIKLITYMEGWRKEFGAIPALADNIRKAGMLNPIIVASEKGGKYEIVAGRRRYMAAKVLGWQTIEVRMLVEDIRLSDTPCAVCGYAFAEETFGTSLCPNHQMLFAIHGAGKAMWERVSKLDEKGAEFVRNNISKQED